MSCTLCRGIIEKAYQRYLVDGKAKFDVRASLSGLPFAVEIDSVYICKSCLDKLKKLDNLKRQERELLSILKGLVTSSKRVLETGESSLASSPPESLERVNIAKRPCIESTFRPFVAPLSPVSVQTGCWSSIPSVESPSSSRDSSVVHHSTPSKQPDTFLTSSRQSGVVTVKLQWSNDKKERGLPDDLQSLGKMLVRGTYKQIANAAWKSAALRKQLQIVALKQIDSECNGLCSTKQPSCLRSPNKDKLLDFSLEKFEEELEKRAPFTHAILETACVNRRNHNIRGEWVPTVGMAAAVLLRNRSSRMNAVQLMLSIFLYHSSWSPTMKRLKILRLVVSHTQLYRKLTEFGQDYDHSVKIMKEQEREWMESKRTVSVSEARDADDDQGSSTDSDQSSSSGEDSPKPKTSSKAQPTGQKITIDNIDYRQEVHHMTQDHQTIDKHYLTVCATENRVSGNHLGTNQPDGIKLESLENGKCIPSSREQILQREDYIKLTERALVKNLPCLQSFKDVVVTHIPHMYSKEAKQPTQSTFLGVIYQNENEAEGITTILKELHKYVPYVGSSKNREYADQAIVGDQLTVERAVNAHNTLNNGFTPKQRLDGLHFEFADWHGVNKCLDVAFSRLYSTASANDKCTLYSDRNLINRRNVKADVQSNANACRRFFAMEVEARLVAAGALELGLEDINETSEASNLSNPSSLTTKKKKEILRNLSTTIVDRYILDQEKHNALVTACKEMDVQQSESRTHVNKDGRYMCRFQGCSVSFAKDGQCRQTHELKHNPPVIIPKEPITTYFNDNPEEADDMLNYQKSLMELGILIANLRDAISEGDGLRVIRCWKFLLLYLKHDSGSQKYSVEVLYLMFQIYALLSPRSAHQLIWNRFIKSKVGSANISLDLNLEFLNRIVKEAIKKLGPNGSKKSIDRICRSMKTTKALMENFDAEVKSYKPSGKHVPKSSAKDLQTIVKELLHQQALVRVPGRSYSFYGGVKSSLLAGFALQKMYHWIDEHKKNIILQRRAR